MLFILMFLYSLVLAYYSLDLLEFIILKLSENYSIDFMLTQLEDLTIILLDFVNYGLLILLSPIIILQFLFYFIPAFYLEEKKKICSFIFVLFTGAVFSTILGVFCFNLFYYFYSSQLFCFNFETSTKVLVDLKKNLFFFILFFKYLLFISLILNLFISSLFFKDYALQLNFLIFFYFYLIGFLDLMNTAQLLLLFLTQLLQLEFFILIRFFFISNLNKIYGI